MARTGKAKAYNIEMYDALDEYMEEHPDTHVIYTSSAAVYGDRIEPQSEHSLVGPVNLYGQSKLIGEAYVQQYPKHTILRLSNVIGRGDGHGVYDSFLNGGTTIFGDGMNVRDYVAAGTVAGVIQQAAKYPERWQGITNVSTGEGKTVLEIFKEINGDGYEPVFEKKRPGDARYSVLDNTKMKGLLR